MAITILSSFVTGLVFKSCNHANATHVFHWTFHQSWNFVNIIPPQFAGNGPWSITCLGHVPSLIDFRKGVHQNFALIMTYDSKKYCQIVGVRYFFVGWLSFRWVFLGAWRLSSHFVKNSPLGLLRSFSQPDSGHSDHCMEQIFCRGNIPFGNVVFFQEQRSPTWMAFFWGIGINQPITFRRWNSLGLQEAEKAIAEAAAKAEVGWSNGGEVDPSTVVQVIFMF